MAEGSTFLQRSFAVIRANYSTLAVATGWPFALLAVAFFAWGIFLRHAYAGHGPVDPIELWHSFHWSKKLAVVAAYFLSAGLPPSLAMAGATAVVWKYLDTGHAAVADAFAGIGRAPWSLLALAVLRVFVVQIGGMFFFLPGVALALFFTLAVPILVVERCGAMKALGRSFSAVARHFAEIFLIYLAFAVVAVTFGLGGVAVFWTSASMEAPWWVGLISFWTLLVLAAALLGPVFTVMLAMVYREEKQGSGPAVGTAVVAV